MTLSNTQQVVIKTLSSSSLRDRFYWTGGTLLAEKYLHHRRSDDIDLFSDTSFRYEEIFPFIRVLKERLKLSLVEEKKVFDRWEFFLHNDSEVRVEFVHYDFPSLKKRHIWQGVYIDSLDDLAANKMVALVERKEPKDVVDVYFLIKKAKYSPKRTLQLGEKKFGVQFTESALFSEALVACRSIGEIRPMLLGERQAQEQLIKDIQHYFEDMSAQYLRDKWK